MKREECKKLAIVALFAIAMAFLEATVVVYLRKLYYPDGFSFPLKGFIEPSIISIEWIREFATIIMLLSVAVLAAKKFYPRLAYFLYAFAVWDIFYYIWLKTTLNWPSSLLESDLLFLIPWPWVSPVLAPIVCSITMIAMAFLILHFENAKNNIKITLAEWIMIISGALLILFTFIYDYARLIFDGGFARDFFTLAVNNNFMGAVSAYSLLAYNWALFAAGELLILTAVVKFYLRYRRK